MKIKHWTVLAVGLVMGLDGPSLQSQEPTPATSPETPTPTPVVEPAPEPADPPAAAPTVPNPQPARVAPVSSGKTAIIKAENVNVRGKARLKSEVVTQLNRGDQVVVLEEIKVKDAGPGEPTSWVKILLPQEVPVWVHGSFVDAATRTVKADRLNMRSGPGENFSVLGQIEKGTSLEVLGTEGDWLKIPAPPEAGAYIASFLVELKQGSPAVAAVAEPSPAAPPVTAEPIPAVEAPPETVPPPSIPVETVEVESLTPEPLPVEEETVTPETDTPPEEVVMIDPLPEPAEAPPELVKRTVYREGIVNRTVSIQAPTYFMLHNIQNGKVINYLFSPGTNIVLKDFYGARVIVKGEEMLDERWPNTPVINVESLETLP